MLGEEYTLEYLPLFDEELAEAVRYIAQNLCNSDAANALVDSVERAITERLFAPVSFEPILSGKDREHPGKVMEVRRFVYAPSDWQSDL